jgi:hypothetical protein
MMMTARKSREKEPGVDSHVRRHSSATRVPLSPKEHGHTRCIIVFGSPPEIWAKERIADPPQSPAESCTIQSEFLRISCSTLHKTSVELARSPDRRLLIEPDLPHVDLMKRDLAFNTGKDDSPTRARGSLKIVVGGPTKPSFGDE